MQLNPKPRTAPTVLAALALFALFATSVHAQHRVGGRVSHYTEQRGVLNTNAISPAVDAQVQLGQTVTATAAWEADVVSAATIAVVDSPADVDVITSATQMDDVRHSFRAGLAWQSSRALTLRAGFTHGFERDYRSNALSAGFQWTSEDRLRSVDVAYALSLDGVCDTAENDGYGPLDRGRLSNAEGCFSTRSTEHSTRDRRAHQGSASLTQVLRRDALLRLALTLSRERGFLASPYREVWLGSFAAQEHHPDARHRAAAAGELRLALEELRAFVSLRADASHDDWGITSVAGTLSWTQRLGDDWRLGLRVRGYAQTGAVFYSDNYARAPQGRFFTGDRELSALQSWSGGLRIAWELPGAGVLHGLKAVVKADIAHTAYPDFHYATQAVPGGFYLVSTLLLEAALGRAPESP